jgi:cobalt-zinc-cadmium efflux system outer membrane protein
VDLALSYNAAFQEQLAELGLTRADVVQAGLITNPDFLLLFPLGAKQMEGTLSWPLDFLWLRPRRVSAAQAAADRTAARLVQVGLDLIRDVRVAYADAALVRERVGLLREAADLRGRIAGIAAARVRAGDAAALDGATARLDAVRAVEEAARLEYDAAIAEERLRALLGLGAVRVPIVLKPAAPAMVAGAGLEVEPLVARAVADRPDAESARLAVEAARARLAVANAEWLLISGIVDFNERGSRGFEIGPGVRATLPIFNQNQGLIARAAAELERAERQQATLRDRIMLDVREAHARLAQARRDLESWRTTVRPALEDTVKLTEKSYQEGEAPLVQVMETNRQLLDARLREAQAVADLRRARAELERGVGRRLDGQPTTTPPATGPAVLPSEEKR